jgi:AcrR family transcriptional regulator
VNRGSESRSGRASPLRTRIRETTEQAILGAAEEVFAEMGLHSAHMGTIAAKAGVSVGTLYNYFEDREALLAGLLAARRGELLSKIDAAIRGAAGRPLRERLRAIVTAFLGHCDEHRQFVLVVLQREMGRYHHLYPQAWAKKTDTMRELFERVDGEIRKGVREKALRPEMADLAGVCLIGMMRALVMRAAVVGGGGMAAESDRLLDLFFAGAAPAGRGP